MQTWTESVCWLGPGGASTKRCRRRQRQASSHVYHLRGADRDADEHTRSRHRKIAGEGRKEKCRHRHRHVNLSLPSLPPHATRQTPPHATRQTLRHISNCQQRPKTHRAAQLGFPPSPGAPQRSLHTTSLPPTPHHCFPRHCLSVSLPPPSSLSHSVTHPLPPLPKPHPSYPPHSVAPAPPGWRAARRCGAGSPSSAAHRTETRTGAV